MKLIDAHAHIFDILSGFGADGELRAIGNGEAIWANGNHTKIVPEGFGDYSFTSESLLQIMDSNNIEKAVLLQGGLLGFHNYYLYETVKKYTTRFRAAAAIDPYCRNYQTILSNLLDNLNFRIFKFESSTGCGLMGIHDTFHLDSEKMLNIYDQIVINKGILVFDLGSPGDESHQPKAIRNIALRYSTTPIVICHLSSPRRNHKEILKEELKIMNQENIFFDLAALHFKTRPEDYPFPVANEFARLAKNQIGVDRLMWGTDAPTTLCNHSIEEMVDYLKPIFTNEDSDKFFYQNANLLYFS